MCELSCLNLDNPTPVIRSFKQLLPGLKITPISKSIILGSPIAAQGVKSELKSKLAALKRMISRLNLIDPHQAFVQLRHSFAIPKMYHLLRSAPTFRQVKLLKEYDDLIRDSMKEITNVDFSDNAWSQASLPVRFGGLGIRKAMDVALPCYISSALTATPLVEAIISSVTDLAAFEVSAEIEKWRAEGPDLIAPVGDFRLKQRYWDLPLIEQEQRSLLDKAENQFARARLLATAQPESGAWANAIPVPNLGTQMSPEELRIAIALRTGSKVCEKHKCRCGRMVDEYGFHQLSCRFSEGRIPRHTALNDIIFRALKASANPAILEPTGLDRDRGTRPDGITIYPFSRGKALSWDATCVNTYAESAVNDTACTAGKAAKHAEDRKRLTYPHLTRLYRFEPIAIETSGTFGPTTKVIISEIGKRISEKSGDARETTWLKQRLSIAVQRGNAISILSQAK